MCGSRISWPNGSSPTVAIDARYAESALSGIGRYTLNLLRGMAQARPDLRLIVLASNPDALDPDIRDFSGFEFLSVPGAPTSLRSQWALPALLRRAKVDLLHTPDVFSPLLWPGRTLLTVHDLIPIICRRLLHSSTKSRFIWVWRSWLRLQCRRASAILTVSEKSAEDLRQVMSLPASKIHVVHNGVSALAPPTRERAWEVRRRFQLPGKIVLYVGRRDPTKNIAFLVRAFALLQSRVRWPLHLVIAGQKDARYQEAEREAVRCGVAQSIRHTGHLDDSTLAALYQEADVFAFPSLYEGFGLPPLEAMCFGTPVVASNQAVELEVLGDAAILVDPSSAEKWAEALHHVLTSQTAGEALRRKGLARVERLSVATQAAKTLELYHSLLSGGGVRRASQSRAS